MTKREKGAGGEKGESEREMKIFHPAKQLLPSRIIRPTKIWEDKNIDGPSARLYPPVITACFLSEFLMRARQASSIVTRQNDTVHRCKYRDCRLIELRAPVIILFTDRSCNKFISGYLPRSRRCYYPCYIVTSAFILRYIVIYHVVRFH